MRAQQTDRSRRSRGGRFGETPKCAFGRLGAVRQARCSIEMRESFPRFRTDRKLEVPESRSVQQMLDPRYAFVGQAMTANDFWRAIGVKGRSPEGLSNARRP